jgi:hypothetical protein
MAPGSSPASACPFFDTILSCGVNWPWLHPVALDRSCRRETVDSFFFLFISRIVNPALNLACSFWRGQTLAMKKYLLAVIMLAASQLSLRAEEWAYTGYYPWVYLCSENKWVCLPQSDLYAWDASTSAWVANPLEANPYTITEAVEGMGAVIRLATGVENEVIDIQYNFSGIEGGYFIFAGVSHHILYGFDINQTKRTCQFYGTWEDDNSAGSFSLSLVFTSADSGNYVLIGNLGLESARIVTYNGTFTMPVVK